MKGCKHEDMGLDRNQKGNHNSYLYHKHENSLKMSSSKRMSEIEYKDKLKGMYKRAAKRSLRMSQKFSVESLPVNEEKYNRALYPSVTQIGKQDSKQKISKNKRYVEENVVLGSKHLHDESLFDMINEIDH
mmetsp:Transcript_6848/g.5999  ORF Transcript_6848/g.5999 Transcript_6848/m.5999 type:complete len:131 (+) Transcript_6848:753-1145(+)